jgi:hypothetical protein
MGLDVIPPSLIVFFSKTALEFFKFPKVVGLKKSQNSIQVDRMGRLFFLCCRKKRRRWEEGGGQVGRRKRQPLRRKEVACAGTKKNEEARAKEERTARK